MRDLLSLRRVRFAACAGLMMAGISGLPVALAADDQIESGLVIKLNEKPLFQRFENPEAGNHQKNLEMSAKIMKIGTKIRK